MIGFNTEPQFVGKFVGNETQQEILKIMKSFPRISAKAIADQIGITPRGVQKNINTLRKMGLVERIGSAKGGQWVVKGK